MSDNIQYFAKHKKVQPRAVTGFFRRLKWLTIGLLLGLYYLAPFLRWDRPGDAPDQAILIDMPHRRLYFFFIEIWPQEIYFLTGILVLAAVMLFFVTSLFGRVWCGYACFQTVWTDLFIWVERQIQGDRNDRIKLEKQGITFERLWKKGLTHAIWLLIALATGGAFVLYFNDAPTLISNLIEHGEISNKVLGFVLGLTASTYVMAGLAREQVCIYMCPYARFQSAMFDKDTMIISYDETRGEKRGKHKAGEPWGETGHCIDCSLCVQVCPTGIDIRNGLQMECIACGLCIDACNGVMDKLGLPRGLIRYDSEHNKAARAVGEKTSSHIIRPRTFWYLGILTVVCGLMFYALTHRSPQTLEVLHDRNPLYVTLSDGSVRNGYNLVVVNKEHDERHFSLSVHGLKHAHLRLQGAKKIGRHHLEVHGDQVEHFRVFVTAPAQKKERVTFEFVLRNKHTGAKIRKETVFMSGK